MTATGGHERRDALPRGTVLRDYTIEAVLGHGGFGIVYRARHNELGNRVAIKEYLPVELALREGLSVQIRSTEGRGHYEDGLRRFLEEARALVGFHDHAGIVSCRDFFRANGTAYLVMEHEEGLPLAELLRRREAAGRPFAEADLLAVMVPLLEGLARVHEAGALHRDIKPSNILVRRADERPVLIDFGAAKQGVAERSKSMAPYTEGYAALEQVGEGELGPWTDLYAAGAVMWRMVAGGNPPWAPPNPVKVEKRANAVVRGAADPLPSARELGAGRFSAGVLEAIDRCLQLNEQERVRGCGELLGLLRGAGAIEQAPAAAAPRRVAGRKERGDEQGAAHEAAEAVGQESVPQRRALPAGDVLPAVEQAGSGRRRWWAPVAAGVVLAAVLGAAWFGLGSWSGEDRARAAAVLARAEAEWSEARDRREAEELRAYIAEYAGVEGAGEWVGEAESLLEELAAREEQALAAWEAVRGTENESELAGYIEQWESRAEAAEFVAEARDLLGDLERVRKVELERARKAEEARAAWARVGKERESELAGYIAQWESVAEAAAFVGEAEKALAELIRPGRRFRDCDECPQMVVLPAGSFEMGSPESEEGRDGDEGPVHRVEIGEPFAVGAYEVTFEEWDACVAAGGCGGYRPRDEGWGRGKRPVINVSWYHAQEYVGWLSGKTGEWYRLLSEAEWEYAARGGSGTRYWWGDEIGSGRANCEGCGSRWDDEQTAPVGSFRANGYGLYDMHGNVWEWVEDCWNDNYRGAPTDGKVWKSGDCSFRVLRGGSWGNSPGYLRSASRGWDGSGIRYIIFGGFRVARTLGP